MDDAWMADAVCRQCDPDLWFPHPNAANKIRMATMICAGCPVLVECRDYAEQAGVSDGIWGGVFWHPAAQLTTQGNER